MKRLVLLALSCIVLSGCGFDESNIGNQDERGRISNSTTENNQSSNENSDSSSYTYYIDKLSDSEVINECKYYFTNVPKQGTSYQDYYSNLKATPVNRFEDNDLEYQFYDLHKDNEACDRDAITWIRILGTRPEMDGSIGYSKDYYAVTVGLIIKDYNRAANIYDGLYNAIVNDHYDSINDNRSSTTWTTDAMFLKGPGLGGFSVNMVRMTKEDDGFHLMASYYVWL